VLAYLNCEWPARNAVEAGSLNLDTVRAGQQSTHAIVAHFIRARSLLNARLSIAYTNFCFRNRLTRRISDAARNGTIAALREADAGRQCQRENSYKDVFDHLCL